MLDLVVQHCLGISLLTYCVWELRFNSLLFFFLLTYPFLRLYWFLFVFILFVCMCITCVPDDNRGLKRILDSLELKLQMVLSHHLHVGNWILFLSARALDQSLIFPLKFLSAWICGCLIGQWFQCFWIQTTVDSEDSLRKEELCSKIQMKKNVISGQVPEMLIPTRM